MEIRHNIIPKHEVKSCKESFTLREARNFFQECGFTSVPVLSDDETIFLGTVSLLDILLYTEDNKDKYNDNISVVTKNQNITLHQNDPFFATFLGIPQYPFISVLNGQDEFVGIVTHAILTDFSASSVGFHKGGYAFTLATFESKGALAKLTDLVNKVTSIVSCATYDDLAKTARRIILTVPSTITDKEFEKVSSLIEGSQFRIVNVHNLDILKEKYQHIFNQA